MSKPGMTALETLQHHRTIWSRKPSLQRLYREEFFSRLIENCVPGGITLEVGCGPGFLEELFPEVISSDVVPAAWIDLRLDCHSLPFASGALNNIVGLDVLHHLQRPILFLQESCRALTRGGRLVLIEPWITPVSFVIYRYMHQEDCDFTRGMASLEVPMGVNGEGRTLTQKIEDPFKGNATIPYLLFRRARGHFERQLPGLWLRRLEPFCFVSYLLSFGFKPINMLPLWAYGVIRSFERRSQPLWQRFGALRALIVLERR